MNENSDVNHYDESNIGPVFHRYIVLLCFSLITLLNCFGWIMFAPISKIVQDIYQVREFDVDCLSMVFMVCIIASYSIFSI